METTQLASGTLFIHSAPTALRSHIEWAADAAFAVPAARRTGLRLEDEICDLLGEPWDVELEAYRACDPSLDVSWLSREVG